MVGHSMLHSSLESCSSTMDESQQNTSKRMQLAAAYAAMTSGMIF